MARRLTSNTAAPSALPIFTKGGDAPNIIPEYTEAKFFVRAASVKRRDEVYRRMEKIVEGADRKSVV